MWQHWEHNHQLGLAGIVPALENSATIGSTSGGGGGGGGCTAPVPELLAATAGHGEIAIAWTDEHSGNAQVVGYSVYYDQAGKSQHITDLGMVTSFVDTGLSDGFEACYKVTSLVDVDADGVIDCESAASNILCATPLPTATGVMTVDALQSGRLVSSGKGKTASTVFEPGSTFTQGDTVVIRVLVIDATTGLPLSGASANVGISGPETATVATGTSGADGWVEASWKTSTPNRKGTGGTTLGTYSLVVESANLGGYTWDGQSPGIQVVIQ